MADWGYVWLYGCRTKSVNVGLGCGLGRTPAPSVTHRAAAVCGLLRRVSGTTLPFSFRNYVRFIEHTQCSRDASSGADSIRHVGACAPPPTFTNGWAP